MERTNVLHPGNRQNNVTPYAPQHMSKFDLSNRMLTTQRFGQLGVMKAFESEPKDNVPLFSSHTVQSYSLTSRLMSDVYLKKDWFQVTRRALLPENYDKIYNNPPFGDDVPDDANTSVGSFSQKLSVYFYTWWNDEVLNDPAPDATWLPKWMKWLTCLQYFYSYGSLVSALGASFERMFSFEGTSLFLKPDGVSGVSLDELVDIFYSHFATKVDTFQCSFAGVTYFVYTGQTYTGLYGVSNVISLRRLLELLHDDPQESFSVTSSAGILAFAQDIAAEFSVGTLNISYDEAPYDLAYCESYQLCCAHFFSNDSIDPVFSADIYRQVVYSTFRDFLQSSSLTLEQEGFFQYNGISTVYDALSAHVFDFFMSRIGFVNFGVLNTYLIRYLGVVFAWRSSLRFGDYFTGARTNPTSIGNVNVAVVGNQVDVMDVITNTQKARFMNFANRARRKLEGYIEDMTGEKPTHDWHNPLWLGHQDDVIYAVETENTGDAQLDPNGAGLGNSITSRFISNGVSKYAFEVDIKEQSILIGICYFDIPRAYSHATRRMYFQKNRYDWFNPFMQTIGDQALYLRELTDAPLDVWDFPFGYKVKHAEYKESFDMCKGALASGKLSTWVFNDDAPTRGEQKNIDERFIRSSSTELDRFYLALTDYSLANYFHFIVCHYSEINAHRNMIVAPTLL